MFQITTIVFVFLTLFANVTLAQFEIPAIDVPLYYDPVTGDVTMDATLLPSERIFGYRVNFEKAGDESATVGLPRIRSEEFTPFLKSAWYSSNDRSVAEMNFSGVPAGVYSLGRILPTGLSRETGRQIADWLDEARDTQRYQVLDELGRWGHYWDFIYGKSPYPPLNGDGAWTPDHERWAESALLLYDPTDGGVVLDSTGENGGAIAHLSLKFHPDSLVNIEAWQPPGDPAKGDFTSLEESSIGEFFTSGLDEGTYDLGKLFPAGLSSGELASQFESAAFVGLPGHSGGAFDLAQNGIPMSISVIPEPSGIGTVTLAFSTLLLVRRRRRSFGRRPSSRCVFVPRLMIRHGWNDLMSIRKKDKKKKRKKRTGTRNVAKEQGHAM